MSIVLLFSLAQSRSHLYRPTDVARTWDMFRSWTRIDIDANIYFPANAIYMSLSEHYSFRRFKFYFDKEAVSHFCTCFCLELANISYSTLISLTSTKYVSSKNGGF